MADKTSVKNSTESFDGSIELQKLQSGEKNLGDYTNKELSEIRKELSKVTKLQDKFSKDYLKEQIKIEKQQQENDKEAAKRHAKELASLDNLHKSLTSMFRSIDSHIQTISQYSIKVNAALDGTQKTYASAVQNLTNAIGSTGLAKMSDVLSRMSELTSKGIVANAEQNAFLDSISDGISSVFDSANGTLLRLIKLQGEDSTVNRLVMQASLKEYLNRTYQNSQYLYEQFNRVSDSLVEATSLLTSSLSLSLESTVQKWMGSLSSLGLSEGAVSSLSGALGAVGSGNLRGINQNMQNLVIMGANRAGLSYSDLLTGGLNADQTNRLMYGMINYLGGLQGNNVVLSEYANLFGLNVSDLVAARNAQGQLGTIMGKGITTSASSLSNYLGKYNQYLNASPATLYDNLLGNMLFGMGANVASNRDVYGLYRAGGLIGGITSSMGLSSTVGNIINLIGPGMQLAAVLGGGEGGLSLANVGNTLKNLQSSVTNLWSDPNALAAYNLLAGTNYSPFAMAAGLGARGARNLVSVSGSFSSNGNAFAGGGGTSIDINQAWAGAEEAASARTADDIYEFLSDDVVTVTPYVGETDILGNIANYNLQTANNTSAIFKWLQDILGPYLLISSVDEVSSIKAALESGSKDKDLATLGEAYTSWQGRMI